MDDGVRSFSRLSAASNQKRPIGMDDELVELVWHNGNVVGQSQTRERSVLAARGRGDRDQTSEPALVPGASRPSTSGLTREEAAPWFQYNLDDSFDKELYSQLFKGFANAGADEHERADRFGATIDQGNVFGGCSPQPPAESRTDHVANFAHFARPTKSNIGSSGTGESCSMVRFGSSVCGSNQVQARAEPSHMMSNDIFDVATEYMEAATLPPQGLRTGAATSSSGGSGGNFGGSGQPTMIAHINRRKGRAREDSDSRSEDPEYEAIEQTKPVRLSASKRRRRAAEVHNLSERRRRDRINEKMRALHELLPHCDRSDKASILDEAIEYLKSLQMQVQIMWMTTGMGPMMFPGAHQFVSPVAMRVNPACVLPVQSLGQLPRAQYVHNPVGPNPMASPATQSSSPMNAANIAREMQNACLGEPSNRFLHPGSAQAASQAMDFYAYGSQTPPGNQKSVVPTSFMRLPSYDGIRNDQA